MYMCIIIYKIKREKVMEMDDLIANLFKAISHPLRIKILNFIGQEGICVKDLCKYIKEGQPQISRALALLKQAGVVNSKRIGKRTCYMISNNNIINILHLAELMIQDKSNKISQVVKKGCELNGKNN